MLFLSASQFFPSHFAGLKAGPSDRFLSTRSMPEFHFHSDHDYDNCGVTGEAASPFGIASKSEVLYRHFGYG